MRIYYGMELQENRPVYATVTGQMEDGTLVYTEIETKDGAIIRENGEPKLIIDNQYIRQLKCGTQSFTRL